MRKLFLFALTAVILAWCLESFGQESETGLNRSYYRELGMRVAVAEPYLFQSRVLPGKNSPCTSGPDGYSVAFYSSGVRYLITSNCNLPGVFTTANRMTFVDFEMDGRIDAVSSEEGEGELLFLDVADVAPKINPERRTMYQLEMIKHLKKLELLLSDT